MDPLWTVSEFAFHPEKQHHHETIFTIGNGYLSTRGAFEEGYPSDRRATFIHGVFDAAPIVVTELANSPDWLPLIVLVNGERFLLTLGVLLSYQRVLDLSAGILSRSVRWQSPSGDIATIHFERFASLADPHSLYLRCQVIPEFNGEVELRAGLNGNMDNEGLAHWEWLDQMVTDDTVTLLNRTRKSGIQVAHAMRFQSASGEVLSESFWDVQNTPVLIVKMKAVKGEVLAVEKQVRVFTSRDIADKERSMPGGIEAGLVRMAGQNFTSWEAGLLANQEAWKREWERTDVIIEGDEEAQLSLRFNLFQMLIAAPRDDDRVNIGAKTLSGFGYRGHAFWDTEIFMLPLFMYTAPHIARNLLNYRFRNLAGARAKALANGFEGAQYPWESADTGEEVTPTWIPDFTHRSQLIRIWTGDIEIHISAVIAYAIMQYWKVTGDDEWMVEKGAEIVLETAKFWASRAEWNAVSGKYEYRDVIGPDENHDHVDNNFFTNRLARWNLQVAIQVLEWLRLNAPARAGALTESLDLSERRLLKWQDVIEKIYFPADHQTGLIEQFEGYFKLTDVDLTALEPRNRSVQVIFGIEGAAQIQVIKQPDVLMLQYLLRDEFSDDQIKTNYDYYSTRTDHTYGSSLGPSIQAIMACEVGKIEDAYEQFIRAVRADLRDVRGNAGDGIHAASAGGTWQTVVFGFGGLKVNRDGWTYQPRLPQHWRRLAFRFYFKGELQQVDIRAGEQGVSSRPVRAFIFDLDGVLTDTAEFHYLAWKRLADEEGIPFTREDNEALRGISRRESLNLLLKGQPIADAQAEAWMERKNNYYRAMVLAMTPQNLLPGALEILQEIRQAGIKIAIASASKNAEEVIQRLDLADSIDILCDGNSVQNPKPAPDLFLFAARCLGISPEYCAVVEDAQAGIESAVAAGMRSIGLGPQERVSQASLILPSLQDQRLASILKQL